MAMGEVVRGPQLVGVSRLAMPAGWAASAEVRKEQIWMRTC